MQFRCKVANTGFGIPGKTGAMPREAREVRGDMMLLSPFFEAVIFSEEMISISWSSVVILGELQIAILRLIALFKCRSKLKLDVCTFKEKVLNTNKLLLN